MEFLRRTAQIIYDRLFSQMVEEHIARVLLSKHLVWGETSRVTIAETVHVNNTLFNTTSGNISVEEHAFFGHNVCLLTGTHDIRVTRHERIVSVPATGRDIKICRGAWIGSNATILGPCTIGEDAVVAAGAVVISDVAAATVVGGVPAKLIKQLDLESRSDDENTSP